MNYEVSDGNKDFWRGVIRRLEVASLAWTTANMRFWNLGRNEMIIGQATISEGKDQNYIFIMPGKYIHGTEKNITEWEQMHAETVFLGYSSAKDLEPLMNLLIKSHREALAREKFLAAEEEN